MRREGDRDGNGNKFCGQCAAPLRTTPTAKFAAPDSYTPKHLAEKILTSKTHTVTTKNGATVLAVVCGRTEPV